MLVEVCCNSLESALNAEKAGANRIELCSELGVGGVTPSFGLIQLVKEKLSIPVNILVRPRSAHFTYTPSEFDVLLKDIEICREIGVDGIVSGVLYADNMLDVERTAALVALSKPLDFTFHRAFDWISNQKEALKQLVDMGVDTVLTSGSQPSAENGMNELKELKETTSKITIMPGGGVNIKNVNKFKESGFKAIHFSGTAFTNEVDIEKKISMNSQKHSAEHHVAVTNEDIVRQIVQTVK